MRDSVPEDHSGRALTDRDSRLPILNHIDANEDRRVNVVSLLLIDHFSLTTSILGGNQLELAYKGSHNYHDIRRGDDRFTLSPVERGRGWQGCK